jgi:endonuclease YncB( thermonuclease family)
MAGGAMLLVVLTLATVAAAAESDQPSAPSTDPALAASVEAQVSRAIDGNSLDAYVDGRRTAVGYLGARTPALNQACGQAALARNRELAGAQVYLVEDPSIGVDPIGRRLFYAYTAVGSSIDAALVREGLAWAAYPDAPRGGELAALQAEAQAAGRGCLWGGSAG